MARKNTKTPKLVITPETCLLAKAKFHINTSGEIHLSYDMLFKLLQQCADPDDQRILEREKIHQRAKGKQ